MLVTLYLARWSVPSSRIVCVIVHCGQAALPASGTPRPREERVFFICEPLLRSFEDSTERTRLVIHVISRACRFPC